MHPKNTKKREPLGLAHALNVRRSRSTLRQLTTSPPGSVDFSSNDFLSLASFPKLRGKFLEELQSEPESAALGSGGSRLLDGNSQYAEQLERDIAAFHNAPSGLLCNSGFDANVSIFSCLPQPGDIIVYDELIHASTHDGMKVSRTNRCIPFAHNDPVSLDTVLNQLLDEDGAVQEGKKNVFVAVEAVYSMDGDVAPLQEISTLVSSRLPRGNGHLIVDEAHATGVFGKQGRGLVCQLQLEDQVTVRLHTFGKALACGGAILLCSPLIREYFVNYARPLIYTTFMTYPSLAAIRASYDLLQDGTTDQLLQNLNMLIRLLHNRLLGLETELNLPLPIQHLLRVPETPPQSAISYVMSSRPKLLAAYCQSKRFVVRAVVPPTVPAGTERIRICLHAGNTSEQITGLIGAIKSWVRSQQGIENQSERMKANL